MQTHREQMELSVRSALSALPEAPYAPDETSSSSGGADGGGGNAEDCALCMELLLPGEMVRTLPSCGHAYHSKCIDRWLLDGQAHQRRRCPLCNADPVETVAITCPPGVLPGDQIRVHHHGDYDVTVPHGVQPGHIFHTNLPARPPARRATPVGSATPVAVQPQPQPPRQQQEGAAAPLPPSPPPPPPQPLPAASSSSFRSSSSSTTTTTTPPSRAAPPSPPMPSLPPSPPAAAAALLRHVEEDEDGGDVEQGRAASGARPARSGAGALAAAPIQAAATPARAPSADPPARGGAAAAPTAPERGGLLSWFDV